MHKDCAIGVLVITGALLLGGCGGGASSSSAIPAAGVGNSNAAGQLMSVAVVLQTGAATPSSNARSVKFISPSTKSMTISVSGGSSSTVNCSSTCSTSLNAPIGTDTFTLSLYDANNGTGNVLSQGTTAASVIANRQNTLSMILNGLISSVVVTPSVTTFTSGAPASATLAVVAKDSDGNIIVGSAPFSQAIALSLTDSSGSTQLSTMSVTSPSTAVSVAYNGSSAFSSATIGAAVSGVAPSAITAGRISSQSNVTYPSEPANAAVMSDSLVDAVGVDTHIGYTNSPYYTAYSSWKPMLIAMGVRHIRDGANEVPSMYNDLAASGIKATYVMSWSDTPQTTAAWLNQVPNTADGIEMLNEPNNGASAGWETSLQQYMESMYLGKVAGVPYLGPALVGDSSPDPYAELGNMSSYLDYGNTHEYFGGFSPGTGGWGSNGYGSIPWNLSQVSAMSGSKPIQTTEGGWCDNSQSSATGLSPQAIVARYIPRWMLLQYKAGIRRTFAYQWIENGNDGFQTCGLLTTSLATKPSYYAMQSLLTTLSDQGSSFQTASLPYAVTGVDNTVQQMLFQKRDGSYYLVSWVEQASYDPNAKALLTVAPQTARITLGTPISSVTASTITDAGTLATTGASSTVTLTDHVTFIHIIPTGSQAAASAAARKN